MLKVQARRRYTVAVVKRTNLSKVKGGALVSEIGFPSLDNTASGAAYEAWPCKWYVPE